MVEIWTGSYKELRKRIRREKKKGNALQYVAVTDRGNGQSTMLVWTPATNALVSMSAASISSNSMTE